jgi:hypothetical protein
MSPDELRSNLDNEGVALLKSFFSLDCLTRLREAAGRCFGAIEGRGAVAERYRFSPQANSVVLHSLLDFGIESEKALMEPLDAAGLDGLFSGLVGGRWRCRLEHSWVRKKFAPRYAPAAGYRIQDWHQDGALGVRFPLQAGPVIPANNLATCWIPLNACGRDCPGLEFIRSAQAGLLHFTELDDAVLRRRFAADAFWAPTMEFGDGLVFGNHVLHRTHVNADMGGDRISVEYRVFPA